MRSMPKTSRSAPSDAKAFKCLMAHVTLKNKKQTALKKEPCKKRAYLVMAPAFDTLNLATLHNVALDTLCTACMMYVYPRGPWGACMEGRR